MGAILDERGKAVLIQLEGGIPVLIQHEGGATVLNKPVDTNFNSKTSSSLLKWELNLLLLSFLQGMGSKLSSF